MVNVRSVNLSHCKYEFGKSEQLYSCSMVNLRVVNLLFGTNDLARVGDDLVLSVKLCRIWIGSAKHCWLRTFNTVNNYSLQLPSSLKLVSLYSKIAPRYWYIDISYKNKSGSRTFGHIYSTLRFSLILNIFNYCI